MYHLLVLTILGVFISCPTLRGSTKRIHVTTFNTALLQIFKLGNLRLNGVVCADQRFSFQKKALIQRQNLTTPTAIHGKQGDGFIILLQEVWKRRFYEGFKQRAEEFGYSVVPSQYEPESIGQSGLMIITNLALKGHLFYRFEESQFGFFKGILLAQLEFENRVFEVGNTHAAISDGDHPNSTHLSHLKNIASLMNQRSKLQFMGGDFNTGIRSDYVDAKYNSKELLWQAGFVANLREPLRWGNAPNTKLFTWDTSNFLAEKLPIFLWPLNGFKPRWDEKNSDFDHILWKRNSGFELEHEQLVLHQKFPIRASDVCFDQTDIHPSDHYGLSASFKTW